MSILNYPDAYLERFCTPEREARAFEDVDFYGDFDAEWRNRLARIRCYMLACLENQGSADDLFASKYKSYRQQFEGELARARSSTPTTDGITSSVWSVPLERG